jgi:hypothetical protein
MTHKIVEPEPHSKGIRWSRWDYLLLIALAASALIAFLAR